MLGKRCHYSMFITKTVKGMWAVLMAIIIFLLQSSNNEQLIDEVSGYRLWVFLGLVAIFLIALTFNFIRWRKTFIYLDDDSLIMDRRTINRKKTAVKLSTIASVNVREGVLEKLFATYRLQLDINSSATAEKTDFDLVFSRDEAQDLRDLLLVKDAESNEESKPERGLICEFTFKEVIRHCVLSISVISIFAAIFGILIWYFSLQYGEDGSVPWIPIAIVVFPAIYQFIRPFFLYHNFKVEKAGENLEISYGFISHQHFSLPLAKTNAIIIRRPALARLFDLCSGEIINIGMGDKDNNQAPLFCLLVSTEQMNEVLTAIAPEYAQSTIGGENSPLLSSPRSALIPIMVSWGLWGLVAIIAAIIIGYWWIGMIVAVCLLAAAYLHWRTKELALLEHKISISSGIFAKRNITADYAKLQNMGVKQGPVSRKLGLAHGNAHILAAAQNRNNRIGYFPLSQFEQISDSIFASTKAKNIH